MAIEKNEPFRYWAQMVLPTVYDDSLSYYELLCKVVKYLNQMGEGVNNLGDSFEKLRYFVENYFNDLNVQEEINKKLDAMVSDGTLTTVIEDILNKNIVFVKSFGAVGDGVTDDTKPIQTAIENSNGKELIFENGKTYLVKKNTSLNYLSHDEPCLLVKGQSGTIINLNGCTIKVAEHGQGVLEIDSCDNVVIKNGNIRGHGSFPKIDPDSGRGEKGVTGEGYFRNGGSYQFDTIKNNSVDTSGWRGFGKNPNEIWGTFGNGFIGNCGSGIILNNCRNSKVNGLDVSGFNYSGIYIGEMRREERCFGIEVSNCNSHHNYNSGIEIRRASNVNVYSCVVDNIGHPDAIRTNITERYKYKYADPGYGVTASISYVAHTYEVAEVVRVYNCLISNCARKGVDSHGCAYFTVKNNKIYNTNASGIEIESYQDGRMSVAPVVESNVVEYCGEMGSGIFLHGVDTGEQVNFREIEHNAICNNNILKNCYSKGNGILSISLMGGSQVCNNIVAGSEFEGENTYSLIRAVWAFNSIISGNTANAKNAEYAMFASACNNSVIESNSLICPGGKELYSNYNDGAIIRNNIFNGTSDLGGILANPYLSGNVSNSMVDAPTGKIIIKASVSSGNVDTEVIRGKHLVHNINTEGGFRVTVKTNSYKNAIGNFILLGSFMPDGADGWYINPSEKLSYGLNLTLNFSKGKSYVPVKQIGNAKFLFSIDLF